MKQIIKFGYMNNYPYLCYVEIDDCGIKETGAR